MSNNFSREPMLEMYIFENLQLLEQLEKLVIESEKSESIESSIDEVFRIMHTIKGSSAMMLFNNMAELAHSIEDLFYYLREKKPKEIDCSKICDLVLQGIDFIKNEISLIQDGSEASSDSKTLSDSIHQYLNLIKAEEDGDPRHDRCEAAAPKKQVYYIGSDKNAFVGLSNLFKACILFEEDCKMENVRAFSVVHKLKDIGTDIRHYPEQIIDDPGSEETIKNEGFKLVFRSEQSLDEIKEFLGNTAFLKALEIDYAEDADANEFLNIQKETGDKNIPKILLDENEEQNHNEENNKQGIPIHNISTPKQSVISVNVSKLDLLMNLVGELVISEAMVTQNPELEGLKLDSYHKAARQLRKITHDLQDAVMSVRMVPLSLTLQKMNRLVRDMSKKVNKEVELEIIGEETEVDKNIIDHISDPLMHLIRNSMDHGLESPDERQSKGKSRAGKITLEARNAGGEVWIIIKDDGRGLNKEKILKKAKENGVLTKPEDDLTDKEIFSFIFLPGFSTKENVTEFSGRGVGMDVVMKNIEKINGTVAIDSAPDRGTTIWIKIPLTLAIIDGMTIKVGASRYTIPTVSIKECFRVDERDVIKDPEENEMILLRGQCIPIIKLYEFYKVDTNVKLINEGIIVVVEYEGKSICIFADALIGQQQVVVKSLPGYLKKVKGLSGCTLLGDGSISLILDVPNIVNG